jgi:hypothetical protein
MLLFVILFFRASLQPYLRLTTIGMTKNTSIKHKETTMICEKNEPSITNYNALIIQLELNRLHNA